MKRIKKTAEEALTPIPPYNVFIVIGPPSPKYIVHVTHRFKLDEATKRSVRTYREQKMQLLENPLVQMTITRVLRTLQLARFNPTSHRAIACLEGEKFNVYEIMGTLPEGNGK